MQKRVGEKHCWYRGYGPFLINDMQNILNKCELDSNQKHFINVELTKIWGDKAFSL